MTAYQPQKLCKFTNTLFSKSFSLADRNSVYYVWNYYIYMGKES